MADGLVCLDDITSYADWTVNKILLTVSKKRSFEDLTLFDLFGPAPQLTGGQTFLTYNYDPHPYIDYDHVS